MADYENMSMAEVQRLARQGDAEALYEMSYRSSADPGVELFAWRSYWLEKAADKGHPYARCDFAEMLVHQPCLTLEEVQANRQKACAYYVSLSNDYIKAGNYPDKDLQNTGPAAQVGLGTLLCEGISKLDGSDRDPVEGEKLIARHMNPDTLKSFDRPSQIGCIYEGGYTQAGEVPSDADLMTAKRYFEVAIANYTPGRDNPSRYELTKELLRAIEARQNQRRSYPEHPVHPDARGRRINAWTPTGRMLEQARELADAKRRLGEWLRREGW